MDDASRPRTVLLAELDALRKRVAELERSGVAGARSAGGECSTPRPANAFQAIASVGVFRTDSRGVCTHVNDRWCEITGVAREEALGRGWSQVLTPEDREQVLRDPPVVRPGQSYRGLYAYRRPDGKEFWIESHSIAEVDEEGRPTGGVVSTIMDVTARKEAEESARRNAEQLAARLDELETIYRNAPVGMCLVDRELRFVRINEKLAAFNGRSIQEHLGRPVAAVIPEIEDRVVPIYQGILETGEPVLNLEVSITLPSDPAIERTWLANHRPVRSANGEVSGIVTVVQDITALKRVSNELRATTERLKYAQQLAGLGCWEWDLIQDRMWMSDELREMVRRSRGCMSPSFDDFIEMVHPEDRSLLRKQLQATFTRGEPYSVEFRAVMDDGAVRLVHSSASLERSSDGTPLRLIGTTQDITNGRRFEGAPDGLDSGEV